MRGRRIVGLAGRDIGPWEVLREGPPENYWEESRQRTRVIRTWWVRCKACGHEKLFRQDSLMQHILHGHNILKKLFCTSLKCREQRIQYNEEKEQRFHPAPEPEPLPEPVIDNVTMDVMSGMTRKALLERDRENRRLARYARQIEKDNERFEKKWRIINTSLKERKEAIAKTSTVAKQRRDWGVDQ